MGPHHCQNACHGYSSVNRVPAPAKDVLTRRRRQRMPRRNRALGTTNIRPILSREDHLIVPGSATPGRFASGSSTRNALVGTGREEDDEGSHRQGTEPDTVRGVGITELHAGLQGYGRWAGVLGPYLTNRMGRGSPTGQGELPSHT